MRLESDRRRLALDALAVTVMAGTLAVALGLVGVGVAAVAGTVFALGSAVYAFGVGQVLVVVLTTTVAGGLPVGDALLAQVGLGALLLGAVAGDWPDRTAVVTAVAFVAAAAGFATVHTLETPWHGAAVIAVVYAVLAYTLHRYELVRLGLVTEADR